VGAEVLALVLGKDYSPPLYRQIFTAVPRSQHALWKRRLTSRMLLWKSEKRLVHQ